MKISGRPRWRRAPDRTNRIAVLQLKNANADIWSHSSEPPQHTVAVWLRLLGSRLRNRGLLVRDPAWPTSRRRKGGGTGLPKVNIPERGSTETTKAPNPHGSHHPPKLSTISIHVWGQSNSDGYLKTHLFSSQEHIYLNKSLSQILQKTKKISHLSDILYFGDLVIPTCPTQKHPVALWWCHWSKEEWALKEVFHTQRLTLTTIWEPSNDTAG